MTTEKVMILDIRQNEEKTTAAGKPYKATILQLKGMKDKLIMQTTVERTPAMKAALESLETGDVATLVHEPKAGSTFTQIVGVYVGDVPDAGPQEQTVQQGAAPGGGWKGKSSYTPDSEKPGAQVGNALNCAARLLAAGVLKGTIETAAESVLMASERLKASLLAGKYKVDAATAETAKANKAVVVDDDIPWSE